MAYRNSTHCSESSCVHKAIFGKGGEGGGEDQYKHVYIIHIYGFMYNVYVCESTL